MIDLIKLCIRTAPVIFLLTGCNVDTVFEEKEDFNNRCWPITHTVRFEFEIEDTTTQYDMFFHIRYTNKYPFQNIYIQHYLEDSSGALLQEKLNNVLLFDPVTGVPLGSGLGDLNTVEKLFAEDVHLHHPGTYRIRMDQFMRMDTLPEIVSVGYRLMKSGEN